ncbi:hypothetical protein GGR57DRAFT_141310 [Xylariaceae sp. FL1272]|nr:hypothetical protein GGR57DRAFT_141310 [Xylariaceae sp. FL1272]
MAQHPATPLGAKRAFPFASSPPALHADDADNRRPPPHLRPPQPPVTGGLQAPHVGVAVVTIDMFREYQRNMGTTIENQTNQIADLQRRVQVLEGRLHSFEDAEDMAIDAVREIRDQVVSRVDKHHESLGTLTVAVNRQNSILETLESLSQELRAHQGRSDAARTNAWRPGPLGAASDQLKSTLDEFKSHITTSFASLGEHEKRMASLERTDRIAQERLSVLEQKSERALDPGQISAVIQHHQQRLDYLGRELQQCIKLAQEAQTLSASRTTGCHCAATGAMHVRENQVPSRNPDKASPTESAPITQDKLSLVKDAQPLQPAAAISAPQFGQIIQRLDAIDKRMMPLEERLDIVEKEFENLSKSTNTLEIGAKEPDVEEESQYQILMHTDFQRSEDLAGLRTNEDTQLLMQLFSEKEKCDDACYTVQRACVHMWSYLLCRSRKDPRLISDFWRSPDWKDFPTVLELERSDAMPDGKYLPRYVYEIGEIFNRKSASKHSGRQVTHRSTGYHLVVDVTSPQKSLWLVCISRCLPEAIRR